MRRLLLALLSACAVAALIWYDTYLFTDRLADVTGNLEASVIWGTPAAVLFLVRSELRHRKREAAAEAQHQERLRYLDAIDAKVDRLHQHLGIDPTAD